MSAAELRFLADESCDFAVVRALRNIGYDVDAVSEHTSRSVDRDLVQQADGTSPRATATEVPGIACLGAAVGRRLH
jgi:hypothetical protein